MGKKIRIVSADNTAGNSENNNQVAPAKTGKKKKKKIFIKILIFFMILALIFFIVLKYAEVKIRPIISSMATSQARSLASRVVSEAIYEEIESDNITYDTLVSFEKDTAGSITALKTNIIMINKLKSRLAVVILNKLSNVDNLTLYIPVGNLINGEFLSGRGPKIEVRLLPVGSVTTDISNVFTDAGINQTRHQILLDVRVVISVIMPFSVESTDILTSICIAETVIVGTVPEMYLNGRNITPSQ